MVVLIEVVEQDLEHLLDLLIDPMTVLQFDNQVQGVDHREMLKADLIIFQVLENEADHTHNLLFVVEIEDLSNVLDHVQLEVLEVCQGKLVIRQDPEATAYVVGDLRFLLDEFTVEEFMQDVEASLADEVLGQFVDTEHVHEAVSVSMR